MPKAIDWKERAMEAETKLREAEREWSRIVEQNWRIITWAKEAGLEIPTYEELKARYNLPQT